MLKVLVFPTTYICDEKCIMCTIPERKSKDLPVDFFKTFFEDPNVSTLQSINITGGEPTLRRDLDLLIGMIIEKCPHLREIIINSNGSNPKRVVSRIHDVLKVIDNRIKLWIHISIDALDDETSDFIRGKRLSATNAKRTLGALVAYKEQYQSLEVGINCTITSQNYNRLHEIYDYAMEMGCFLDFSYATVNTAYINSEPYAHKFVMDDSQKVEVIRFLNSISFEKIGSTRHYFDKLIERLRGVKGNRECVFFDREGLLLEADGKVRVCGMTEESYLGDLHTESPSQIIHKCTPNLSEHCKTCETNSYFNWTRGAQEQIGNDMFSVVKSRRK